MYQASWGLIAIALVGCVSHARQRLPELDGGFPTPEARLLACLDLQDRMIDWYVDDYLRKQPEPVSGPTRALFRAEWGNELAKGGTFDRFEMSCATSLTKPGYGCAMWAPTPTDVSECLKKNADHPQPIRTDDPRRTG